MADIAVLGLKVDASGAIVATENLGRALNTLGARSDKSELSIARLTTALAGIGVSAAGLVGAVAQAAVFEKQMALVATVVDTTRTSIKQLSAGVLETFGNIPVGSLNELTSGLYDILSAGVPAAKALDLLDVAARAAIAGVTSTKVSVDGLTTVLAAFKREGLTAAQASDSLFQAVNVGKITFEELASSIGTVAPVAASYNIKLNDILASTAQLTLGGLGAAESFTAIRSAITNIIQPTEKFRAAFPALAKEFNATKLEAVGFTQFLLDFNKATGGSKEALNALFTDVQGKVGVFSLLADGGAAVAAQLKTMEGATGASDAAFQKLNLTTSQSFQLLKNQLQKTLIEVGTKALPLVNVGLSFFLDIAKGIKDTLPLIAGSLTGIVTGFILWSNAARAVAIYIALLDGLQTIQAFISLALTVRKIADAMALLSLVSKGAVGAIAAIAALAAGLLVYRAAANAMAKDTAAAAAELEKLQAAAGDGTLPTITPAVTPTGTTDLGLSQEQLDAALAIREANEDRLRLSQQALALEKLVGDEYERQVILNEARNTFITETRGVTDARLKSEIALSIEAKKQADLTLLAGKRAKELQAANSQRVQDAADGVLLAGLEGEALARQNIEIAQGKAIQEARRTLTGIELSERIKAINLEAQLKGEALGVNVALDARNAKQKLINEQATKILEDQKKASENFERQFLQTVSGGIEGVLKNGLDNFRDFTTSIKDLFIKMFADLLAANVFKRLTTALGSFVPGAQFDLKNVANANFGGNAGSLAKFGAAAGVGAAAFGVGSAVGGLTSNRGLGAAGGALSGAATGALIGSVVPVLGTAVGAVVGAVAGLVGGLLGSAKRAREEAAARKQVLDGIETIRNSFNATDPLAEAVKTTKAQFDELRKATEGAFKGGKNEAARNVALAEINKLEAQRIDQLKAEAAEVQRRAQVDLKVRELRAKGLDEEAVKLTLAEAQTREYAQAVKDGADAATLAQLSATQLAEAQQVLAETAKVAAAKIEDTRRTLFDLANDTRALTDPRGANQAREAEEANRRIFDAIIRGAGEAELAAISLYNAALAAANAAALAEQDRRTTESLVTRGLTASGNARASEDSATRSSQRQELADAIKSGFSPTNLALLQFTQFAEREAILTRRAIEDGTKAINDAAAKANQDLDVLIEVTRTAAKSQIAAINKQITEISAAGVVSQKGFDNQITKAKEDTKLATEAIDAQIAAQERSNEIQKAQLSALEKNVAASERVVDTLTKFTDSLKLGDLSTLSPEAKLAEARSQFEALAGRARGGDATAATDLPAAASALLQASKAFNATNPAFAADFDRVNAVITAITAQFGATLPIDRQQLEALQRAANSGEAAIASLNAQKDAIQKQGELNVAKLEEAKQQDAEATKALIEALEKQKDKISADADATINKLEELKKANLESAQKQIDQLIADENAKLQTRLRENEFYDLFQTYAEGSTAYFELARAQLENPLVGGGDGLGGTGAGTGAGTPSAAPSPIQVALEATVAELKEINRQVTERLTNVESQLERLINTDVETHEREVDAINRGTNATLQVAAAVRDSAQLAAARRPIGIAGRT